MHMTETQTSYTTCPLCEATCGLEIVTRGREILSIRGDAQDIFSHGYICPKAFSLKELATDRARIREPMVRRGDHWLAVSWEDAFAEVERGLAPILQEHGRNALAIYAGNPTVHNLASLLYLPVILHASGTPNFYSASPVNQIPHQLPAAPAAWPRLFVPAPPLQPPATPLCLRRGPR